MKDNGSKKRLTNIWQNYYNYVKFKNKIKLIKKKRLTNGLTSRFGYNITGIKEVGVFLGYLFLSPLVPCFSLITTHVYINNIEGPRFIFI